MKTIVLRFRAKFNRTPSTDHALAVFSQAQEELQAVIAMENAEIESIDDEIEMLAVARYDAFTRRDRAKNVAAKLEALVSA